MKRRWIYAPAWVDYTVQFAGWIEDVLQTGISKLGLSRRYSLLDRYCKCPQCEDRRARGLQQ